MRRFGAGHIQCLGLMMSVVIGTTVAASAQAGRRSSSETGLAPVTLPVILDSPLDSRDRVILSSNEMELYDGGVAQKIDYFRPDYSPAKIVLLVDNSETLRASVPMMADTVKALGANLYQGDQLMLIGYDEQPEIIEEFTDDREKLEKATALFRKKGAPKLLDALQATINDVFHLQVGVSKRVVLLLSDGYDRKSRTRFKTVVSTLERENTVVYVLQAPDRTHGAPRRRGLKPVDLIQRLTRGTGGRIFPLKDVQHAVREMLQELSERWYQLTYKPTGINPFSARRLLITIEDPKIHLRTKLEQPGERF